MVSRWAPPEYSGAGQQAARLGAALADRGVPVRFFTSGNGRLPRRERILGVPATRWPVPFAGRLRMQRLWFAGALFLHLLAHPRRYAVVHLHGQPSVLRVLRAAKRLLAFSVVYKATMDGGDDPARVIGQQGPSVLGTVDRWVCITAAMADGARAAGVPSGNVWAIPNGVDLSSFRVHEAAEQAAMRIGLGLPLTATVWITVGALVERKRIDLIIEAWAALRDSGHVLLVVGPWNFDPQTGMPGSDANPYVTSLSRMIAQHGLEQHVHLLGSRSDVPRLLGASDGFVFASSREGSPNALYEALACGLPVVTTPLLAGPDIQSIGGARVVVVEPDAEAIAAAVRAAPAPSGEPPSNLFQVDMGHVAQEYGLRYRELGVA